MFENMTRRRRFEVGDKVHFVCGGYAFLGTVQVVLESSYMIKAEEYQLDTLFKLSGAEIVEISERQLY